MNESKRYREYGPWAQDFWEKLFEIPFTPAPQEGAARPVNQESKDVEGA